MELSNLQPKKSDENSDKSRSSSENQAENPAAVAVIKKARKNLTGEQINLPINPAREELRNSPGR
jgi:hypothetical protein